MSFLNYNITLQSNNTDLQAILDTINELPETNSGNIKLPELINEGVASDLFNGKQLIDGDGQVVTGSFSIDAELTTQDDLIAQIQVAIDNLPEAGSGNDSISYDTCAVEVSTNTSLSVIYSTIDENGKITMAWTKDNSNTHLLTVICESYIFVPIISTIPEYIINGDAECIEICPGYSNTRTMVFKINGISTINCYDND